MIKKNESFTIDQNDICLSNIFVRSSENNVTAGGFRSDSAQWRNLFPSSDIPFANSGVSEGNVICIAVDTLPEEQIEYCRKQADLGKRVYILLGDKEKNHQAIERLAGKCLIRTGVMQCGALRLQDGNSGNPKGLVFPTDIMADSAKVEIDMNAAKWLYQTFCYLFWKEANHEYFSQDKPPKELTPNDNPVMEIQIDEPYGRPGKLFDSLREDISRENHSFDIITSMKNCNWILDVLPSGKQCRNLIFTILEGEKASLPDIEDLCKNAINVSISESSDIGSHNVVCGSKTFYLPKYVQNDGVNWVHVKKSDSSIKEKISQLPLHWRLKRNCMIGDLKAGEEIRFANQPSYFYRVVAEKEEDLNVIFADNIDDYLNRSPEEFCREKDLLQFNRDRFASQMRYSVEIRPPVLPPGAKRDELEISWDKIQKEWEDRLHKLEQDIAKNEQGKLNWGSQVRQHLSQFMVGQEQKISEYKTGIDALRSIRLGKMSRGEREQKWEKYLEVHRNIAYLMKKTDEEKKLAGEVIKWEKEMEILNKKLTESEMKISKEKDEKRRENLKKETERIKEDLNDHQMNRPKNIPGGTSEQFGKVIGVTEREQPKKLLYPSEDLPLSDGSLYSDKNKRYLAIKTLENLAMAKKDAEILNAKICIIEV